eukprot:113904_1
MFALFFGFILSLFIFESLGTTLFFVNNSDLAGPKITDYVVTIDLVTSESRAWYTSISSNNELFSGGVVCDNIYYGVWVDLFVGTGLFAFDLLNGNLTSYITTD